MGMDLYIKRRKIKEQEIVDNELLPLYKEQEENTKEFIKNYKPAMLTELVDYDRELIFGVLALQVELTDSEEDEKIWGVLEPIFSTYQMFGLLDDPTESDERIHSFIANFYDDQYEYKRELNEKIMSLEEKRYRVCNEEILYRRKDEELKSFLRELAIEKGLIEDYFPSHCQVPFEKQDLINLMSAFDDINLEEYLVDFDDENILIYGYHSS